MLYSFPVIFITLLLFGFSAKPKEVINKDILFDTCFEYIKHLQNDDLKEAPFESNATALPNIKIENSEIDKIPDDIVFSIDSILTKTKDKTKKDSL
ncbi:MAG TPA: hypothetical protein PL041_14725, partial [Melioribacteraceae bacterium]|nr:hypothetical protein [Melioribacteraceae bacterium]